MKNLIETISGEIPGGFLLLLFLLVSINLALFYFYKHSGLITLRQMRQKSIKYTFGLIFIYAVIWNFLQPPRLPDSVLVVPFQKNIKQVSAAVPEGVELALYRNIHSDYRVHHWEWFWETLAKDSALDFNYRLQVAQRLNIQHIISGIIDGNSAVVQYISTTEVLTENFEFSNELELSTKVLAFLNDKTDIQRKQAVIDLTDQQLFNRAKIKIKLANGQKFSQTEIDAIDFDPNLQARILINEGNSFKLKTDYGPLEKKEMLPEYSKALNLLLPLAREGKDTYQTNLLLGELFLHDEQFENAEIFLKKSISQYKFNPRAFYLLSFLHPSRFEDMEFRKRADVLEQAVRYDPGYIAAANELAEEYFSSGSATATGYGSTMALTTLDNILKVVPDNYSLLKMQAGIYGFIKKPEEAIGIYKKLITISPDSADLYYNIGVADFKMKQYDESRQFFYKAIRLNNYPDAYLYLGAVHRIKGERDSALYYYRQRVRLKKNDEDRYAREAMKGIRKILREIAVEDSMKNLGSVKK